MTAQHNDFSQLLNGKINKGFQANKITVTTFPCHKELSSQRNNICIKEQQWSQLSLVGRNLLEAVVVDQPTNPHYPFQPFPPPTIFPTPETERGWVSGKARAETFLQKLKVNAFMDIIKYQFVLSRIYYAGCTRQLLCASRREHV